MVTHVDEISTPPTPADAPEVFEQRASQVWSDLARAVPQMNEQAQQNNAAAQAADAAKVRAIAEADAAMGYRNEAVAARDVAGGHAATASAKAAEATTKAAEAAASALSVDPAWRLNPTGVQSINGGQLAGMRNKIINGGFKVNQREYVSGAATVVGQYTLDRWKVTSTAGITFSTTDNKTTVSIPAGQTLQQVIEGLNIQSGTYVLSWEGTAQARIGTGSYGASGSVKSTITGGTNTTVEFSAGTVANVQFELGDAPTVFEQRPIASEVAECLRYYQRYVDLIVSGIAPDTGLRDIYTSFALPTMRATPTVGLTTNSYTNSNGAVIISRNTPNHLRLAISTGGGIGTSYWQGLVARSADF